MKKITFSYKNSLVSEKEIARVGVKLKKEIENMNAATKKHYEDDRASINIPFDGDMLKQVKNIIQKKKQLKPEYLVVVGMGGSILGTTAIKDAVLGTLYNELNPKIKILFIDNIDADLTNSVMQIIEPILRKGKNIIISCASKSGTTTEAIANFEVLVSLLKKYKKDYNKYIVITSQQDTKLWNLAQKNNFDLLENPEKVGGRYSVLCPIGLFPLGMLGVNISELLQGAKTMRTLCLKKAIKSNPATLSAIIQYIHYKRGKNISDIFLFNRDLASIGNWYRQLMGESIGKEHDIHNKKISTGITPTVSVGSTDLHSVAQLYLGGPYDKFTTFVTLAKTNSSLQVPKLGYDLVDHIENTPYEKIMDAVYGGVAIAYKKGKRPFVEVVFPDKSPNSIAQFLQFKMMEMMYLGYLLEVNPFDQPNVESYKIETKKLLAK